MDDGGSKEEKEDKFNFNIPSIMIPQEDANSLELWIKLDTLRPSLSARCTPLRCWLTDRTEHPQDLVKNATFDDWSLTESSLFFVLRIRPTGSTKRSPGVGRAPTGESYRLKINQFPTLIHPEQTKMSVKQVSSGASYLVLKLVKQSRDIWAEVMRENGGLDLAPDGNAFAEEWHKKEEERQKREDEEKKKVELQQQGRV